MVQRQTKYGHLAQQAGDLIFPFLILCRRGRHGGQSGAQDRDPALVSSTRGMLSTV